MPSTQFLNIPISLGTITQETRLLIVVEVLTVFGNDAPLGTYWVAGNYPNIFKTLTFEQEVEEIKNALMDFLTTPSAIKTEIKKLKSDLLTQFFPQHCQKALEKTASSEQKSEPGLQNSFTMLFKGSTKEQLEKLEKVPLTSVEYATKIVDGIFNYSMPLEETFKYALVDQQRFERNYEYYKGQMQPQSFARKHYLPNLRGNPQQFFNQMSKLQQTTTKHDSNNFFANSGTSNSANSSSSNSSSSTSSSSSSSSNITSDSPTSSSMALSDSKSRGPILGESTSNLTSSSSATISRPR